VEFNADVYPCRSKGTHLSRNKHAPHGICANYSPPPTQERQLFGWLLLGRRTGSPGTALRFPPPVILHGIGHVNRLMRLRGSERLRSKRSSFRDTINQLYRDQAHSYVDDSRYLCAHRSLTNFRGTVAIFDVLQKPMCRHRLDAATVPLPFILPSLLRAPFALIRSLPPHADPRRLNLVSVPAGAPDAAWTIPR
jgi:hypothetical protein